MLHKCQLCNQYQRCVNIIDSLAQRDVEMLLNKSFQTNFEIDTLSGSDEIEFNWVPKNPLDDKSMLVQELAW